MTKLAASRPTNREHKEVVVVADSEGNTFKVVVRTSEFHRKICSIISSMGLIYHVAIGEEV